MTGTDSPDFLCEPARWPTCVVGRCETRFGASRRLGDCAADPVTVRKRALVVRSITVLNALWNTPSLDALPVDTYLPRYLPR